MDRFAKEDNNPTQENQSQSTSIPQSSTPHQTIKQKGYFLPIVGALVILLIIVGGIYYFMKVKSSTPTPTQTQIVTPTTQPSTVDETSNWKTYQDKQYNFSFSYPSNIELDIKDINKVPLKRTILYIREGTDAVFVLDVYGNPSKLSLVQWVDVNAKNTAINTKISEKYIDNKLVIVVASDSQGSPDYYLENNGAIFRIGGTYFKEEILSTFKFTKI